MCAMVDAIRNTIQVIGDDVVVWNWDDVRCMCQSHVHKNKVPKTASETDEIQMKNLINSD